MKNKKRYNNRSKKPKIILIILIIVFVLTACGGAYYFFVMKKGSVTEDDYDTPNTLAQTVENDKTREAESEGETFPVPENVPDEAIINYKLITENEQYKIRKDPNKESYLITLYAVINRPDQYDMYRDQLAEYKRNALGYLSDQGVDTNKVEITYEPEEAKDL